MKPLLIALTLSAAVLSTPALALNINSANVTRTLSFPDPAPQPVTKDKTSSEKPA